MIRITAAYPRATGKRFDMDYYVHKHLPFVLKEFGPYGLIKAEADRPLEKPGGGESPFFCVGYLYFRDLAGFQKAFKEAGAKVMAEFPKYTDVMPIIQVGEIVDQIELR